MPTIHAMDATGDTRHEWDPRKPEEVELARKIFKDMQDKKFLIYRTRADGSQAEQMRTFDPKAERIIGTPQTVGG